MRNDQFYRTQFSNLPPFLNPIYKSLVNTNLSNEEIHDVLKKAYVAIDEAREDEARNVKESI